MTNRNWDFTGQLLENGKRIVTSDQVATTTTSGLMSATDKTKLDSLIKPTISGTTLLLN